MIWDILFFGDMVFGWAIINLLFIGLCIGCAWLGSKGIK